MGSFPDVRSKSPRVQRLRGSGNPVFGGLLRHATLHAQRTPAPKPDNSQLVGNQGILRSIHPILPFPSNCLHLSRIRCASDSQDRDSFGDHILADALPQLAIYQPPVSAKRPDNHRRRLQPGFLHQPKCSPGVLRGFYIDGGGR